MIDYIQEYIVDKEVERDANPKIKEEIKKIKKEIKKKYDTKYASFNLAQDSLLLKNIKLKSRQYMEYDTIVVVGIGGSNLGAVAIIEALYGKNYNLKNKKKIYFSDTVDSESMEEIISFLKIDLESGKKVIINIISKSGTTTETIANFQLFYQLLNKYKLDLKKHIIITTDKNSKLWDFGEKMNIPLLEIPKKVGGRFSVFSAVGLFPLATYGVNINNLLKGARDANDVCLETKKNPAIISSMQLYYSYLQNINIIENFFFETKLESIGKWYRQLMGESIGKQYDLQGKEIWMGLTPMVAIGSTDLHSMAQLYLGGPFDKYTFFIIPNNKKSLKLSDISEFNNLVSGIKNKKLSEIMDAIIKGIQKAFLKQNRPFSTYIIDSNKEYDLGFLMQIKMYEIIFLAKLLDINPFDQPNVEEYKIITKKELN